jgi:hypothetical protein
MNVCNICVTVTVVVFNNVIKLLPTVLTIKLGIRNIFFCKRLIFNLKSRIFHF